MTDVLRYGPHPSQYAVLHLPTGPGPWPVAVVLHGGFWRAAYGAELGTPLADDLSTRGVAALNVEYRRVGDDPRAGGGGWPTTCLDVAAGVDLLAESGQRVAHGQLDLSRVVALGHSAGGHLAGWLGSRGRVPTGAPGASPGVRLSGFVSQAGVLDLSMAIEANLGAGAVQAFLGTEAGWDAAAFGPASPIDRVPLGVPSVCVHGTADDIVPISQSVRFVAAARAAGDSSRLVAVEGADHFAVTDLSTAAWAACKQAVLELSERPSHT